MAKATSKPPPNTYRAHRERQKRRILDSARALFDEHGIDRVTMAELTAASGVQPSTLYQYFANKDDVVWALLRELMAVEAEYGKQNFREAPNALAGIEAIFEHMADELAHHRERVRFIAQFDALYARNWPAERLLQVEAQFAPEGFAFLGELIRRGIADGSLRSDLDPEITMHAVFNTVIATQRRLASLGSKVEIEYGQPVDRLFRETIRVLLLGLRATRSSSVKRAAHKVKTPKRNSTRRPS
jgi:AcrR family transcriptional regulator